MVITSLIAVVFLIVSFVAWMFKLVAWWEFALLGSLCTGIYLYRKKDLDYWNCFFVFNTIAFGSRFILGIVMATNGLITSLPLTFDDNDFRRLSGFTVIVAVLGRYVVDTIYVMNNKYNTVKYTNTYKELIRNRKLINLSNFYLCNTVITVCVLLCCAGLYNLQGFEVNIAVFIGSIIAVKFAEFLFHIDCMRRKKEEFVEKMNSHEIHEITVEDLDSED